MFRKRKMKTKAYIRRCERRRKRYKKKKPLPAYKELSLRLYKFNKKDKEENDKITIRLRGGVKRFALNFFRNYALKKNMEIFSFHRRLKKYRKKKRYKIKRKSSRKVKTYIENIYNYPDRKIQPKWVSRKIAYVLSYYRMYKHLMNKSTVTTKQRLIEATSKKKLPTKKLFKQKRTFRYNNKSHAFVIKSKELTLAKSYKNITRKPSSILKKVRSLLWKIMRFFKAKNRRSRKKARYLRFNIRMLNKYSNFKKYRYRTKKLYKKMTKKKSLKKKVKMKVTLKNKRKRFKRFTKVIINPSNRFERRKFKTKILLRMLKRIKRNNGQKRRKIQNILHHIKRETLSINQIIRRKRRRKFYWLTTLRYTKRDISNAFCLRLLRYPSALQKLLLVFAKK